MELFLYTIIFIIGTFFGSFFTLAVYRIPRKEDILIKHSYCPNCNHKLGFFDLFPVLSYILLVGKCRYCKNKIRPRYLILELLSGLTFLILAIAVKIDIFSVNSIINVVFVLIYASILFIIAGIDKENINIEKSVLIFGFIFELLYIIYQYTLKNLNVYQYVMYLIMLVAALFILKFIKNNNERKRYIIQNLFLSLYMIIYSGLKNFAFTVIIFFTIILIYKLIFKNKEKETALGFCLSISNILTLTISNIMTSYII